MEGLNCRLCRFAGSDVKLSGCGCTLHAKCVPVPLVVSCNVGAQGQLAPVQPNTIICPICNSAAISLIEMFPMTTELLDLAVKSKQKELESKQTPSAPGEECFGEIQAETPYLLLSHSGTVSALSGLPSGSDFRRTGRWSDEETEFVDFLVHSFDKGVLPLPGGVRLNDFLCSMLLCKASRLTKKMKNARLSVRSYEISCNFGLLGLDFEMLTTLQEKFLQSISDETSRLELRFNMEKAWRTNLSNLCVQVGNSMLDASAWIASLEVMEKRAAEAEEKIRKARRRRMGLALKTDVKAQQGVFFSGVPVQRPPKTRDDKTPAVVSMTSMEPTDSSSILSRAESESSETRHISNMLDIGSVKPQRSDSIEDFAVMFNDLIEGPTVGLTNQASSMRNNCGSFLEEVLAYMEAHKLPFEHVDVWVPSYAPQSQAKPEDLRLYHAGYASRNELDPALFCQLHEYGEYSTKFSFAPGVGLPGRVYNSGMPSWECRIDEADPKVFERAGGAKIYGVKTGVGFPISSDSIGRVVVAMYSLADLAEDAAQLTKWAADLAKFCPKPTWKLVVEAGTEKKESSAAPALSSSSVAQPDRKSKAAPDFMAPPISKSLPSEISLGTVSSNKQPLELVRNNSFSSSTSGSMIENRRDEEMRIATLLGDHMPGAEVSAPGGVASSSLADSPNLLLPHFMSLRLLLLRSPERRTVLENDFLEVIRKSYGGFSRDPNRGSKEIAYLLAKDWRYLTLSASMDSKKPAVASDVHQCHVMSASNISTYTKSGAPVQMPPASLGPILSSSRKPSFDEQLASKKRRVSTPEEGLPPTAVPDDNRIESK